jgi:choline dehydrogenase-like flavoprotein
VCRLIEAGPAAPEELKINVPGMYGSTQGGQYDWNFTSTPQPELNSHQLNLTRGKVLGGSSAMNYMLWNRASAPEYDAWESVGNPGWDWDSMLSGMAKSENFTKIDSQDYGHSTVGRGTQGPIHNMVERYRTEQVQAWVPTLENLGLSHNLESMGGNPIGAMVQQCSVNPDNITRSYSANSYVPQAGPNLTLLLSTRVAKINLETSYKKSGRNAEGAVAATGVTLQDGSVILARKEVILSAGSLQSPGILELSGVGQQNVLDAVGVKKIIDLPGVGENFQGEYHSTCHTYLHKCMLSPQTKSANLNCSRDNSSQVPLSCCIP